MYLLAARRPSKTTPMMAHPLPAPRIPRFPCAALALLACLLFSSKEACGADQVGFVPASDPRFRYEGRYDLADPEAPVVIWQASRIAIDFEGDSLALRLMDVSDQCFFNAVVDGHSSVVALRSGRKPVGANFRGLGAGRHTLRLFKRSEASAGTARFRGIEVAAGARAWAPAPPRVSARRWNSSGTRSRPGPATRTAPSDQWDDRRHP